MVGGAFQLMKTVHRWQPQVVVLSLKQVNLVGRLVLTFFPAIHCVSFEHIARYRAQRGEWLYEHVLRALSFRVNEVWADCAETLVETRRYFSGRRRREAAVPLFCVDTTVAAKDTYAIKTPVRMATAGRMVARKNLDVAIRALGSLCEDGMSVTLDHFGDGPEEQKLKVLCEHLNLSDRVTFHGYRAHWISAARNYDLFLNLSDTEGFCIVVAEAMSIGLPAIATNVGGVREYGKHGANVLKLESSAIANVVDTVKALVESVEIRERIGLTARVQMLRDYSSESISMCGKEIFAALSHRQGHVAQKQNIC
jgi:glycosyltransferase involved in cell wall biosynthesis